MTEKEAILEIKRIAKECGHKGDFTSESLAEMAKVYLKHLDKHSGEPSIKTYWKSTKTHRISNLTQIQWLLTQTPSFKKWFGKSVIVDENDEPMALFHGSANSFREFKADSIKVRKSVMTLWSGPGFYFTDKRHIAKIYAKPDGNVMECFVRLENPLYVDETGSADKDWGDGEITNAECEKIILGGDNTQWLDHTLCSVLARMDKGGDDERNVVRGKVRYKKMTRAQRVREFVSRLKTDVVKLKVVSQAYGAKNRAKMLKSICKHTGYDGLIHTIAPGVVEYVVYDPRAIKDANRNCGEFDKQSSIVMDSSIQEGEDYQKSGLNKESVGETEKKGIDDMTMKNLLNAFRTLSNKSGERNDSGATNKGSGLDAACDALKSIAMDIVDRNGRHHEPKGIPPGGQFESEGKYATTTKAKEEYYHKKFASSESAKSMRNFCAGILSHIDSSKLGNDTANHYYKQQIHKYADMTKQAVLDGAAKAFTEMRTHARIYDSIKGMGKDEFKKWVGEHPEYNSMQMQNLLENKKYDKVYKIKNANGEYEDQDHAAWEEAKMLIARRASASMIDYMAHIEALNNTPDWLIDNYLEGKGGNAKHTGGYEAYQKEVGIKHGEGEEEGKITLSEIQAVESEMSKAFADAKEDDSKTSYAHSVSHILGKDGGMRDPKATRDDVIKKATKRFMDKIGAFTEAKTQEEKDVATNGINGAKKALHMLLKVFNLDENYANKFMGKGDEENPNNANGGGNANGNNSDNAEGEGKEANQEKPKEAVNQEEPKPDKPKSSSEGEGAPEAEEKTNVEEPAKEEKPKLNAAGKKFLESIGNFLKSGEGKKFEALSNKVLKDEDRKSILKELSNNGISSNKKMMDDFLSAAKDHQAKGEKDLGREALAKFFVSAQFIHQQLSELAK